MAINTTAKDKAYPSISQISAKYGVSTAGLNVGGGGGSTSAPKASTQAPKAPANPYANLVNVGGEIQNTVTGKKYSTEDQLAADLGVARNQINWGIIPKGAGTTTKPAIAPTAETMVGAPRDTGITPTPVIRPTPVPAVAQYDTNFPQQVALEAPKVVEADKMIGDQITQGEVGRIANEVNREFLRYQKALQMPRGELQAYQRRNQLAAELRDLSTEQLARETGLRDAPSEVGQAIVGRQINALNRYISSRQMPLINELQAQNDIIATYQTQRNQMLKQLEVSINQGQFNLGLAKEYDAQKRAEQKEVKNMIIKSGISARYAEINGTVYDSMSGEPLSLEEFQRRTGQAVGAPEAATRFDMVEGLDQAINKQALKSMVNELAGKYWDAGIMPTDNIETAVAKAKASSTYRASLRTSAGKSTEESTNQSVNTIAQRLVNGWQERGFIQGNGTVSSKDYKQGKREFAAAFAGLVKNPSELYDQTFSGFVDRSGVDFAREYGLESFKE